MAGHLYERAFMMSTNSGLREAPPTRKPSTSGWPASSLQFPPVTEPVKCGEKNITTELQREQHQKLSEYSDHVSTPDYFGDAFCVFCKNKIIGVCRLHVKTLFFFFDFLYATYRQSCQRTELIFGFQIFLNDL